jgi:hypothetical protein
MTPRESAIELYTARERAFANQAREHKEAKLAPEAREDRWHAILLHRAMLAELRDPAPIEYRQHS